MVFRGKKEKQFPFYPASRDSILASDDILNIENLFSLAALFVP